MGKNMKLRYYLRGLGIGIAVTAVIMGLSNDAGQSMSDAEIRQRAIQLGMVDSSTAKLSDLQQSEAGILDNEDILPGNPDGEPEPEADETRESEAEPTAEPEADETRESEAEPTSQVTSAADRENGENSSTVGIPTADTVVITISRGAGSGSVSRDLQEAGLISDAKAYDQYLCDNGYSRSIRIGTYEIAIGTDEETIAKIITGKQ